MSSPQLHFRLTFYVEESSDVSFERATELTQMIGPQLSERLYELARKLGFEIQEKANQRYALVDGNRFDRILNETEEA